VISRMGYDTQCERCGVACMFEDVDEEGICQECQEAEADRQAAYWKPLYDGEKAAGLLEGLSDYEMRKLKGMI